MSVGADIRKHLLNSGNVVEYLSTISVTTAADIERTIRSGPPVPPTPDQTISGAVPSRAVFVVGTGGGSGRGRGEPDTPTAQISVRSLPHDYDSGEALADVVYDALHLRPPPDYFEALSFSGRPAHLHQDEQGHHLFVFNVKLRREVAE